MSVSGGAMGRQFGLKMCNLVLVAGLLFSLLCLGAAQQAPKGSKEAVDISKHLDEEDDGDLLSGIIGGDDHEFEDDGDDAGHEDHEDHDGHGDFDFAGGDDEFEDHEVDPEEEAKWREQEEEYFKNADKNGDGMLDPEEYKAAMVADMQADEEGMQEKDEEEKTADQEYIDNLGEQFKEEDRDGDGMITLKEWMDLQFHEDPQAAEYEDGHGGHMTPEEIAEQKEEAMKEFNSTDKNSDGKLTEDEVVELVMRDYEAPMEDDEEQLPKDELKDMAIGVFKDMDRNNDTVVTFEEFFDMHMGEAHEHDESFGYEPHEGDMDPSDLDHDIDHHLDKLQHIHGESDELDLDHHELEHPDDLHMDHDLDEEPPKIK